MEGVEIMRSRISIKLDNGLHLPSVCNRLLDQLDLPINVIAKHCLYLFHFVLLLQLTSCVLIQFNYRIVLYHF